jgi:hypothetical protein
MVEIVSDKHGFTAGQFNQFCVRSDGPFSGKAIYLPGRYDYVMGNDGTHDILVPLKK